MDYCTLDAVKTATLMAASSDQVGQQGTVPGSQCIRPGGALHGRSTLPRVRQTGSATRDSSGHEGRLTRPWTVYTMISVVWCAYWLTRVSADTSASDVVMPRIGGCSVSFAHVSAHERRASIPLHGELREWRPSPPSEEGMVRRHHGEVVGLTMPTHTSHLAWRGKV